MITKSNLIFSNFFKYSFRMSDSINAQNQSKTRKRRDSHTSSSKV
jgi:serine/threonine protein phosphatase PrpC